ncbi:hypothetical protein K470DRAFT_263757 [Piedraia hortae CBS 480.64]|uniref:Uncharacterized protein n=1 Tax=Piedraia hortae CBS 480.64 TaxID=1314780 RepID=A0A6A7C316_9PEZI|nr:hypothetical protein K470DRAFT_263757 [Piedraia hortae CBS 480.64]
MTAEHSAVENSLHCKISADPAVENSVTLSRRCPCGNCITRGVSAPTQFPILADRDEETVKIYPQNMSGNVSQCPLTTWEHGHQLPRASTPCHVPAEPKPKPTCRPMGVAPHRTNC